MCMYVMGFFFGGGGFADIKYFRRLHVLINEKVNFKIQNILFKNILINFMTDGNKWINKYFKPEN